MSVSHLKATPIKEPGLAGSYDFETTAWLHDLPPSGFLKILRWVEILGASPDLVRGVEPHVQRVKLGRLARRKSLDMPANAFACDIDGQKVVFGYTNEVSGDFFSRVVTFGENGLKPYERAVQRSLKALLGPGALFIDCGAHVGYFSCYAAKLGATVMAVEIQPTLCNTIAANAFLNNAWRLHTINAALGAEPGIAQFMRNQPGPGTFVQTERTVPNWAPVSSVNHDLVPILTLDQLMKTPMDAAPSSILIKIDVEGAEGNVIQGAQKIISERRAAFIVELHLTQTTKFGHEIKDIITMFDKDQWRFTLLNDAENQDVTEEGLMDFIETHRHSDDPMVNIQVLFQPR